MQGAYIFNAPPTPGTILGGVDITSPVHFNFPGSHFSLGRSNIPSQLYFSNSALLHIETTTQLFYAVWWADVLAD